MIPIINPSIIGLEFWNPDIKFIIVLFIADTGATTPVIMIPIKKIPNTGYRNIGFTPSNVFGNTENTLFKISIIAPARNPEIIPPKNPAPPLLAIRPPINPTTIPGLSPIDIAINADNIGIINENAS